MGLSFVRFDPRHRGTIYVGAYTGGIYRSTDGGATWQSIPGQPMTLPDGETARPMRSALDSGGALYLSYANKSQLELISKGVVYRLDTEAGTWTNITPVDPQGLSGYGYCGIGVDSRHAGTVMVATWNRAWFPGDTIFRSKNSGVTWTSLTDYSVRDGSLSPFVYAGGSVTPFGNWISSVEIDPFDSDHALYTTGATVWGTHDLTNADSGATVHWTIGADGIEETAVNTLASPTAGAHLLSGMGDVCGYRHDDFSVSQPPFLSPWMQTVSSLDFAASNPSLVVRVGLLDYNNNAAGAYSLDQGTTWTRFAANAPGVAGNPGMIAVSADGNTFVWAPIAPPWLPPASPPSCSRDRGATWTPSAGAPTNLWVVADRVNSNKFYGFHGPTGTAYVSLNGGATFAATATGLPQDAGNNITNQARPQTVPGREGDIWLPLATGLYHSTDSGVSFTRVSSIDSAALVGFGQVAPGGTYPAVYAVGTMGAVYGIFRSDDQAATWTRINDDRHQFGLLSVITGDPRIYGRVLPRHQRTRHYLRGYRRCADHCSPAVGSRGKNGADRELHGDRRRYAHAYFSVAIVNRWRGALERPGQRLHLCWCHDRDADGDQCHDADERLAVPLCGRQQCRFRREFGRNAGREPERRGVSAAAFRRRAGSTRGSGRAGQL